MRNTGEILGISFGLQLSSGTSAEEGQHTRKVHIGSIGDCSRNLTAGGLQVERGTGTILKISGMAVRNCNQRQSAEERRCWAHENVQCAGIRLKGTFSSFPTVLIHSRIYESFFCGAYIGILQLALRPHI
jgi:hypothetical protein